MTKQTAIQAMQDGAKVRHENFSPDEWMKMEGNEIVLEDGVRCTPDEFWIHRQGEDWQDGWSIYIGK